MLWLWRRPVATAPIRPLAWEPPYAAGAAQEIATATTTKDKKTKDKRQKKKKKKFKMKKVKRKIFPTPAYSYLAKYLRTL